MCFAALVNINFGDSSMWLEVLWRKMRFSISCICSQFFLYYDAFEIIPARRWHGITLHPVCMFLLNHVHNALDIYKYMGMCFYVYVCASLCVCNQNAKLFRFFVLFTWAWLIIIHICMLNWIEHRNESKSAWSHLSTHRFRKIFTLYGIKASQYNVHLM